MIPASQGDLKLGGWGRKFDLSIAELAPPKRRQTMPVYSTSLGSMYCGLSEDLLPRTKLRREHGKAQLVFTSPPFPLNTKKQYGNLSGREYVRWLSGFSSIFLDGLTYNGSIVIEIGNAWQRGEPVMSTIVLKALLRFLESGGLHLCQEFVWYNPARLPSPAQWVSVDRIRVKDAFTKIWWMSPVPRPKADNRKILRKYSRSMNELHAQASYNAGERPSGHIIGKESFKRHNGGAIPPNVLGADSAPTLTNLLKGTNTHSTARLFCCSGTAQQTGTAWSGA